MGVLTTINSTNEQNFLTTPCNIIDGIAKAKETSFTRIRFQMTLLIRLCDIKFTVPN